MQEQKQAKRQINRQTHTDREKYKQTDIRTNTPVINPKPHHTPDRPHKKEPG